MLASTSPRLRLAQPTFGQEQAYYASKALRVELFPAGRNLRAPKKNSRFISVSAYPNCTRSSAAINHPTNDEFRLLRARHAFDSGRAQFRACLGVDGWRLDLRDRQSVRLLCNVSSNSPPGFCEEVSCRCTLSQRSALIIEIRQTQLPRIDATILEGALSPRPSLTPLSSHLIHP